MTGRTWFALLVVIMALAGAACGGGSGGGGAPEVDAVVEAVRARDESALVNLVGYRQMPCTSAEVSTAPAPRCRLGEEEGALVEVVKFAGCEDAFLRVSDVPNAVQHLLDPRPEVYAVFRAPPDGGEGDHVVVLTSSAQGRPVATGLVLEDGKIVSLDFGCGETPEEKVAGVPAESFIIKPSQPTPSS